LSTPSSVADVGEHALIARVRSRVPPDPGWVAIGLGDDAAVFAPERNALEVVTTDALVEACISIGYSRRPRRLATARWR